MEKKKIFYGIFTNYIQTIIGIALGLLLSPLVLKLAGRETMGAYAIFLQIIGYVSLVDLGFGYSAGRYLVQAHALGQEEFKKTASIFKTVATIQNCIMAFVFFILGFFTVNLFGFSAEIINDVKISFLVLSIWTFVSGYLNIYNAALYATNDMAIVNIIAIITNFTRLLLSFFFVFMHLALLGLILSQIVSQILTTILSMIYFKKRHGYLHLDFFLKFDDHLRGIFSYSIYGFLIMIATKLIFSTDNIVIGYLFGAISVSIYYLTAQPSIMLYNLILKIPDNFFPTISKYFAIEDYVSLQKLYLKLIKYSSIIMIPVSYGIIFFTKDVVNLWVGPEQYLAQPMAIWCGLVAFNIVFNHISGSIIKAEGNNMRKASIIYFFEGIINLVLSLFFAKLFGLHGVMLGTLLASFVSLIWMFSITLKILRLKSVLILQSAVKLLLPLFCLLLTHFFMTYIVSVNTNIICSLLAKSITSLFVYFTIIYMVYLNEKEKLFLKNKFIFLKKI